MKNPNGYGSVICLDKTGKRRRKPWAVRITVGFDESGKQLTKYLGYYKSQKEAAIALAQYHMVGLEIEGKQEEVGKVFSAQEIGTLWQHADDYHVQLVLVMIYTGVRANELLKINTANTFLSDHYFITGSKTDAGNW